MRPLLDQHDQVAGRSPPRSGVPHPAQWNEVAVRHPGRDLDRDRLGLRRAAVAAAGLARGLEHPAVAPAPRAGRDVHELAEQRLLDPPDLSAPLALRANLLPGAAAPAAGAARAPVLDAELLLHPARDLFQRELEPDLEIVALARHAPAAPRAAAEELVEPPLAAEVPHERAQRVGEIETAEVESRARARRLGGMSELVVPGAPLRVAQHLVGFGGFLEAHLGALVAGIAVGMVLERELAVGLLDLVLARRARDAEHLVVVALGHGQSACRATITRAGRSARPRSW